MSPKTRSVLNPFGWFLDTSLSGSFSYIAILFHYLCFPSEVPLVNMVLVFVDMWFRFLSLSCNSAVWRFPNWTRTVGFLRQANCAPIVRPSCAPEIQKQEVVVITTFTIFCNDSARMFSLGMTTEFVKEKNGKYRQSDFIWRFCINRGLCPCKFLLLDFIWKLN